MIKLNKLERINFFNGRLLTADDLTQEQTYDRGQRCRHNQLLHGAGIVYGLDVSVDSNHSGAIRVEPGLALDCFGNEICIPEPVQLQLPTTRKPTYLCVKYCDQDIDFIPVPIEHSGSENSSLASRIQESFELEFESTNPFSDHTRYRNAWLVCGEAHSIPLARFRFARKLVLDRRFVAPRMK